MGGGEEERGIAGWEEEAAEEGRWELVGGRHGSGLGDRGDRRERGAERRHLTEITLFQNILTILVNIFLYFACI